MDQLSSVLGGFAHGLERATPYEVHLRNAYYRTLNRLVREAASNFARRASHHGARTAAVHVPSPWGMPDKDEVLSLEDTRAALLEATTPIRTRIVSTMIGDALTTVGVSFAVQNPLAQHVLTMLGRRITEITELTRTEIMRSLAESHAAGLSIPHAARAMAKDVRATNVNRATLIARTEFIGAQNGASLAAVRIADVATSKTWLATNDARTRIDHADASGQTVPLQDAFSVGGVEMMFPGDQSAPADEVCNCRCTITYE